MDKKVVVVNPNDGPTTRDRVFVKFAGLALAVAALCVATLLFWGAQSTTILDIHNAPFPTRTIREHPTAGGVIILDTDYCKTRNLDGDLRVSFVSASREIFLPITKERGAVGCHKSEIPVLIPKDIPADTYKIKFRVTYDVNPLKRNITQEFESQPVVVDESASNPNRQTQESE